MKLLVPLNPLTGYPLIEKITRHAKETNEKKTRDKKGRTLAEFTYNISPSDDTSLWVNRFEMAWSNDRLFDVIF